MQNSKCIKECLDKLLSNNDTVFIVPHNRPDFDALGASIGMSLICKKNKKKSYIVIDDNYETLTSSIKKMIYDIKSDFELIKSSEINKLITEKSLLIAVDVNKDYLVSVNNYLENFNDIFILDHHMTDEHTIKTPYTFIDHKLSSASEEVSRLVFLYGAKLNPDYANYLLAGIILDTNKLSKNTAASTLSVAAKLVEKGADPTIANNLFLEDYEHDRAIQRLVDNTDFPTYVYAIATDSDNSVKMFQSEDIAKAADYLLKYNVNATFAIARIDEDTISISARGKGSIDVSKIMRLFGGGGNEYSAAARVKGKSISEIKEELNEILNPSNYLKCEEMEKLTLSLNY